MSEAVLEFLWRYSGVPVVLLILHYYGALRPWLTITYWLLVACFAVVPFTFYLILLLVFVVRRLFRGNASPPRFMAIMRWADVVGRIKELARRSPKEEPEEEEVHFERESFEQAHDESTYTDANSENNSSSHDERQHQEEQQDAQQEEPFDPWKVLEVTPGATKSEIAKAYRAKMKQYHPDIVANLAKEFRDLAENKAKEINQAFSMIK